LSIADFAPATGTIVEVEWIDSEHMPGWDRIAEITELAAVSSRARTLGYWLGWTPDDGPERRAVVVPTVGTGHRGTDAMGIPVGCILALRVVEEPDDAWRDHWANPDPKHAAGIPPARR
jgi:hypothetical protein